MLVGVGVVCTAKGVGVGEGVGDGEGVGLGVGVGVGVRTSGVGVLIIPTGCAGSGSATALLATPKTNAVAATAAATLLRGCLLTNSANAERGFLGGGGGVGGAENGARLGACGHWAPGVGGGPDHGLG